MANPVLISLGISTASNLLLYLFRRRDDDLPDPELTLKVQESPAQWVVGRARTAGVLANAEVSDEYLYMDILLSEGEVEDIERVWVDQKGYNLGPAITSLTDFYGFRPLIGLSGVLVRPYLSGGTSTLRGVAYVRVAISSDQYSVVPRIAFLVRGIKIAWPGQADPIFTNNAAAIRYWWLTERRGVDPALIDEQSVKDAVTRCGETIDVDVAGNTGLERFLTAPDTPDGATPTGWSTTIPTADSDEIIWWSGSTTEIKVSEEPAGSEDTETIIWSVPRPYDASSPPTGYAAYIFRTSSSTYSQPRYTINGVIESGEDVASLEADMDFAWQGAAPQVNGMIKFLPGEDRTPTVTIGSQSLSNAVRTAKSLKERANILDLTLLQSWEKDWERHSLDGIKDTALITRDGREFRKVVRVRFVPDAIAATRLGTIFLRRLRTDRKWILTEPPAPADARAAPGDHVTLNPGIFGGTNQIAQVERTRVLENLSVEYEVVAAPQGTYADTLTLPDLDPWGPPPPPLPVEALTGLAHTVRFSTYTDGSIREFVDLTWDKPEARVTTRIRFRPVGRLIGTDRANTSTSRPSWTGPVGTNLGQVTGQDVIDSLNPPDDLPDWRERTTDIPRMTLGPDDDVDFPLIFAIQGRHERDGKVGTWSAEMLVEVNGPTMPAQLDTWAAAVEGGIVVLTANPVNARDVASVEYTVAYSSDVSATPPAASPHNADNIIAVAITPGAPIRVRHITTQGAGQYVFAGRIVDKASNFSAVVTTRAVVSETGSGDHVPIERDVTDADAGIVGRVYMRPLVGTPPNFRILNAGPVPKWDHTYTAQGEQVDGYDVRWRPVGNTFWGTASTTRRNYNFGASSNPGLTYEVQVRAKYDMELGWWTDILLITG